MINALQSSCCWQWFAAHWFIQTAITWLVLTNGRVSIYCFRQNKDTWFGLNNIRWISFSWNVLGWPTKLNILWSAISNIKISLNKNIISEFTYHWNWNFYLILKSWCPRIIETTVSLGKRWGLPVILWQELFSKNISHSICFIAKWKIKMKFDACI